MAKKWDSRQKCLCWRPQPTGQKSRFLTIFTHFQHPHGGAQGANSPLYRIVAPRGRRSAGTHLEHDAGGAWVLTGHHLTYLSRGWCMHSKQSVIHPLLGCRYSQWVPVQPLGAGTAIWPKKPPITSFGVKTPHLGGKTPSFGGKTPSSWHP